MPLPTSPAAAPSPEPAAPMFASVTTEELTAGGLVRKAFAVWWKNLFRFAGVSLLLVFLPAMAVGVAAALVIPAMARRGAAPDGSPVALSLAIIVVVGLAVAVQVGALTYGAVQHLADRPVRFGAMVGAGFRRALPLFATGILAYLALAGGLVLLVVPGVIVGCGLFVALPAVVVERIGPFQALRRSWALTRERRLLIFASGVVLFLVVFAANLFARLLTFAFPVAAIVALPVQVIAMSLPVLLPAVAYHDLRIEKEGVDTSALAKVFE